MPQCSGDRRSLPQGGSIDCASAEQVFSKHGADFKLSGKRNPRRGGEISRVINRHISNRDVRVIDGFNRGDAVTDYINPNTGQNIIC